MQSAIRIGPQLGHIVISAVEVEGIQQTALFQLGQQVRGIGFKLGESARPGGPAPRTGKAKKKGIGQGRADGEHIAGDMHDLRFIFVAAQGVIHITQESWSDPQIVLQHNRRSSVGENRADSLDDGRRQTPIGFRLDEVNLSAPSLLSNDLTHFVDLGVVFLGGVGLGPIGVDKEFGLRRLGV